MKKTASILILILLLCCPAGLAENAAEDLPFRSLPGTTCYPVFTEGTGELGGHFMIDCPMDWDAKDVSTAYGLPMVMAVDPENYAHMIMIAEIGPAIRGIILEDESHPVSGFVSDGLEVIRGKSTDHSRILEEYVLNDLPAVRVEMTGQGFEMIWVSDPDGDDPGTLWFFMYPADPEDEEYTRLIGDIADSFTVFFPKSVGETPEEMFGYTITDGEAVITAYTGDRRYVIVPSVLGGCPVTAMAGEGFYETSVKCVAFPDSIRALDGSLFGGCTELVAVRLPADLTELPAAAFESCMRLMDPGLNEGLVSIGPGAFWGNFYLMDLALPDTLTGIADNNFVMCNFLYRFTVSDRCEGFRTDRDGMILYSRDGERLLKYSFLLDDDAFTVPDGVKKIDAYCFSRASLTDISLPESLEEIGVGAFAWSGVTVLTVPQGVTRLGVMQAVNADGDPVTGSTLIGNSLKVIRGVPGSPAEEYAERFGLTFEPVGQE